MLGKAVERVDPISVQRLLNSSVVDRFSEIDQSYVVILELKSLLNGQRQDMGGPTEKTCVEATH